jgi:branched-chain amino acid transport system substrate-binding protein
MFPTENGAGMARVWSTGALALVTLLTLSACSTDAPQPTPTPTPAVTRIPAGDGVLRLGTLFPTSGTFAFLGPAQVAGVEVAVREINGAGGVNGMPVEVLHRDSGEAGNTKAEESFADLASRTVDVVIGPSSSALAERLVPAAVAAKITVISPAATFPGLSLMRDDGLFFRTIPAYGHQGRVLGEVLSEKGPVDVGLVYSNDALEQSLAVTLDESLIAEGSKLVAAEAVATTSTDVSKPIAAVVKASPDVVVLATSYNSFDQTKELITQLLASGFTGAKLWLTTQNTGDYSQALPASALSGVNGILEGTEPDDAFKARLKQSDPNLGSLRYAAEAYDATILAALAAIVSGDDAGASVAATLESVSRGGVKCVSFGECLDVLKTQSDIDYDGISGPLNFDSAGDIAPAYYSLFTYNTENKFVFARGLVGG